MYKPTTIVTLAIVSVFSAVADAREFPRWTPPVRNRPLVVRRIELDGDGHKNDEIEGAIWEYKIVTPAKTGSKNQEDVKTVRGKLRIKGNAIYAVGSGPKTAEQEHRVGDVARSDDNNTLQLRFDDHEELKGRAVLKPNKSRQEGGVYTGYYLDENKKRSKFELRRGED